MTESNKREAHDILQRLQPEDGKNIKAGIKTAMEIMHKRKYVNTVTSIFLFSDGRDENAGKDVRNLIDAFDMNDIFPINTFASRDDYDRPLLRSIEHMKDGEFYVMPKSDVLSSNGVIDCLGSLTNVAAENVHVNVTPLVSESLPTIQIRNAYGFEGCWTNKDSNFQLRIPRLMLGRTENFILELEILQNKIPRNRLLPPVNVVTVDVIWAQVCGVGYFGPYRQMKEFDKETILKTTISNPGVVIQQNIDAEVSFQYYRARGSEIVGLAKSTPKHLFDEWRNLLKSLIEEMKASPMTMYEDFGDLISEFEQAFKFIQFRNKSLGDRLTNQRVTNRDTQKLTYPDSKASNIV